MITRREVVTGGVLGTWSTMADAAPAMSAESQSDRETTGALSAIRRELEEIRRVLDDGLRQPGLAFGVIGSLRKQFEPFLRGNQKYPDYCDIGSYVFTDVYDWHVKHGQPIEITRVDNRTAIRFMFTWLVLVPAQDANFIGIPYDRV